MKKDNTKSQSRLTGKFLIAGACIGLLTALLLSKNIGVFTGIGAGIGFLIGEFLNKFKIS